MEVADDGHAHALLVELLDDVGHGGGRFFVVDGDAHQFRAGAGQRGALLDGRGNIGGIGIGHGLHHDRCIRADAHAADDGGYGFSAWNHSGMGSSILSRGKRSTFSKPHQFSLSDEARRC